MSRAELPVLVVEAEPVLKTDWRTSTFHAATLERLFILRTPESWRAVCGRCE
jgi:hypothetical protein